MFIENLDTDDFFDRYYDLQHSAVTYFLSNVEYTRVQNRDVKYVASAFPLDCYIGKYHP